VTLRGLAIMAAQALEADEERRAKAKATRARRRANRARQLHLDFGPEQSPSPMDLGWECERWSFETGSAWRHYSGVLLEFQGNAVEGDLRARVEGGEWFAVESFSEGLRRAHGV